MPEHRNIDQPIDQRQNISEAHGMSALLARLSWMMVGPALLIFAVYQIVTTGSGWLTRWDAFFIAVVVLMLTARWFDLRFGTAMTATGEPATISHLKLYCRMMPFVAAGIWIIANLVGNHLLD